MIMKRLWHISIILVVLGIWLLVIPDPWEDLKKAYPEQNSQENAYLGRKVKILNIKENEGLKSGVIASFSDNGVNLETSWPRNLWEGNVFIPWSSISACAQTLWCPERDTNLWLDELHIEITLSDTNLEILKLCDKNNVPVLTPKMFRSVIYNKEDLEKFKNIKTPQLFHLGCGESSYL